MLLKYPLKITLKSIKYTIPSKRVRTRARKSILKEQKVKKNKTREREKKDKKRERIKKSKIKKTQREIQERVYVSKVKVLEQKTNAQSYNKYLKIEERDRERNVRPITVLIVVIRFYRHSNKKC